MKENFSKVSLHYHVRFLSDRNIKHLPCLLSELNQCYLDLSELNRLIQGLQALEVGQAFTNGDLKRIISIQVGSQNKSCTRSRQHRMPITIYMIILSLLFAQNLSLEKPKRPRSGKMWGHSRTLSRVEALGMVRMVRNVLLYS